MSDFKQNSFDEERSKIFLHLSFDLAEKMCQQSSIEKIYKIVLDGICRKLGWDYGELWCIDYEEARLYKSTISHIGSNDLEEYDASSRDFYWGLNEGLPGRTWASKKSFWVTNIQEEETFIRQKLAKKCGLKTGVTVPIFAYEHVDSILFFFSKKEKEYDFLFMELLQHLAGKIGLLIVKHKLENEVSSVLDDMKKLVDLNFRTLSKILEYRDPYTIQHQKSVANVAVAIAKRLGYDENTVNDIYLGSVLHDIGKICVPMEILNKPTKLSNEEFSLVKLHPQTSFDIIKDFPCNAIVKRMMIEHHERNNGEGYPKGLIEKEISPESKVLIVSDVVSAMLEYRPYRRGMSVSKVIKELELGKNIKYDEKCAIEAIILLQDKDFLSVHGFESID